MADKSKQYDDSRPPVGDNPPPAGSRPPPTYSSDGNSSQAPAPQHHPPAAPPPAQSQKSQIAQYFKSQGRQPDDVVWSVNGLNLTLKDLD